MKAMQRKVESLKIEREKITAEIQNIVAQFRIKKKEYWNYVAEKVPESEDRDCEFKKMEDGSWVLEIDMSEKQEDDDCDCGLESLLSMLAARGRA
jgi:hypothetical protein